MFREDCKIVLDKIMKNIIQFIHDNISAQIKALCYRLRYSFGWRGAARLSDGGENIGLSFSPLFFQKSKKQVVTPYVESVSKNNTQMTETWKHGESVINLPISRADDFTHRTSFELNCSDGHDSKFLKPGQVKPPRSCCNPTDTCLEESRINIFKPLILRLFMIRAV